MEKALCGHEDRSFVHPRDFEKRTWNDWLERVKVEFKQARLVVPEEISKMHPCGCRRVNQPGLQLLARTAEAGSDLLCVHCNVKLKQKE